MTVIEFVNNIEELLEIGDDSVEIKVVIQKGKGLISIYKEMGFKDYLLVIDYLREPQRMAESMAMLTHSTMSE